MQLSLIHVRHLILYMLFSVFRNYAEMFSFMNVANVVKTDVIAPA